MSDTFTKATGYAKGLADFCSGTNQPQNETPDDSQGLSQKPEPDFLCACNGKACGGICRAKSGHFRHAGSVGLSAEDGGCTAAYRPPKPKDARRSRR